MSSYVLIVSVTLYLNVYRVVLSGPTTNQATSKQANRTEASGGVVGDIKIENFDIAYGNK